MISVTILGISYLSSTMEDDDFLDKMGDFLSRKARNIRDRFTYDQTDLIRAVGKSSIDDTQRVLEAGVDPDKADIIGRRALTMAVDANSEMVVAMLLKAGADPNLLGKNGDSPLLKAIFWENSTIISLLLDAGADPTITGNKGLDALQAVRATGVKALIMLVENFDQLKKQEKKVKDKELHERQKAQAEKARAQKSINEAKAKEEARAAAQDAAIKRYPEANVDPLLALIKAIQKQDEDALAMFLLKVEDVNQFNKSTNTTPLLAAIQSKNAMATGLLLERGADPLMTFEGLRHTGLSLAIQKKAYGLIAKIFELFPEKTAASLNEPNQEISPQFLAYKDPKLFNLLVKAGADPYFGGTEGQSPVIKAIAKGGLGMLPVLVRHGIPLDKVVENKTPIQWAIFYNRIDWVQGLKAEGVKVTDELIAFTEQLGGRDEILESLK